ncbi:PAS domain S-box protein [Spirosoma arcticum]
MPDAYKHLPNDTTSTNERLLFALQAADIGTWELDPIHQLVYWDERCQSLFGTAQNDVAPYSQVLTHVHPDDRQRVDEAIQRALTIESGGQYTIDFRPATTTDGQPRWLRCQGRAYFDEQGGAYQLSGIAQDVTPDVLSRQQADANARQQQQTTTELLQSVLDSAMAGISVLTSVRNEQEEIIDFEYRLVNRVTEQINNRTDLIGQRYSVVHSGYRQAGLFDDFVAVVQTGRLVEKERHYTSEGFNNQYVTVVAKLDDGVVLSFRDITQEVEARQQIEASEIKLRSLIEEAPVATCLFVGRDMRIELANEAMIDIWGKGGSVIGQPLADALPELKSQHFLPLLDELFTTGRTHETKAGRADLVVNGALGTYYFDYTFKPLRNANDEVYAIMEMAIDVTSEVMTRRELETSEARFRSIVEQAPMAIGLLKSRDMVIETGNAKLFDVWGKDLSIIGRRLVDALPELQGQGFVELLEGVYDTGELFSGNGVPARLNRHGQLDDVYFDFVYTPSRDVKGAVTGVMVLATDVTEQVVARQKLQESETYFRQLTDTVPAMIWITEADGSCSYLNKQWYEYTGQTKEEAEGFGWLNATHPDDMEEAGRLFLEANERQTSFNALYRLRQKDGSYRWSIDKASPRFSANGNYEGMIGTVIDVHEQTVARQQLVDSEAKFRALIEEAPVATCLFVGRDLRIDIANEAMIAVWGKGRSVIGQPLHQALPELRGQHFLSTLDTLFTSGDTYEAKADRADLIVDGVLDTYYFDYTFKPLRNVTGEVYAILETAVDVTEQVQSRQKLEASEARLRTLAAELEQQVQLRTRQLQASVQDLQRSNQNLQQFAYVASHDLQEPLRKIQSFGDLLKSQYGNQLAEGIDHLQRMQSAASRMSVLIKDLLLFSRISTQQDATSPVSLTTVVDGVLSDLDVGLTETGARVTVEPLPTVQGDDSQLGQLFQNLLSNALKFRRPNTTPTIQITAQTVAVADLPPTVRPARMAVAYYRIEVSDDGIGFDDKYVDRIFQVFQRLHGRNQYAGTGIGLAICEKVAANHGGAITATSQPGQGATFSVYLPVLE